MWVMCGGDGESGPSSRDEFDFIISERNRIKFDRMHNTMKELKFDRLAEDEETGSNSTKYSLDDTATHSLLGKRTVSKSSENLFKFGVCTICLSDFDCGDKVKQVPQCHHTFHSDCLEKWLVRKFSCPNCNLEIKMD
jgi:hypothetical protein